MGTDWNVYAPIQRAAIYSTHQIMDYLTIDHIQQTTNIEHVFLHTQGRGTLFSIYNVDEWVGRCAAANQHNVCSQSQRREVRSAGWSAICWMRTSKKPMSKRRFGKIFFIESKNPCLWHEVSIVARSRYSSATVKWCNSFHEEALQLIICNHSWIPVIKYMRWDRFCEDFSGESLEITQPRWVGVFDGMVVGGLIVRSIYIELLQEDDRTMKEISSGSISRSSAQPKRLFEKSSQNISDGEW